MFEEMTSRTAREYDWAELPQHLIDLLLQSCNPVTSNKNSEDSDPWMPKVSRCSMFARRGGSKNRSALPSFLMGSWVATMGPSVHMVHSLNHVVIPLPTPIHPHTVRRSAYWPLSSANAKHLSISEVAGQHMDSNCNCNKSSTIQLFQEQIVQESLLQEAYFVFSLFLPLLQLCLWMWLFIYFSPFSSLQCVCLGRKHSENNVGTFHVSST